MVKDLTVKNACPFRLVVSLHGNDVEGPLFRPVRDNRQREHRRNPFLGVPSRENQVPPERARAELTSDLAHWARRHAETPTRVVRA